MSEPKPPNSPEKLGWFKLKAWLLGLGLSFLASFVVHFMMSFGMLQRLQHATVERRMRWTVLEIEDYQSKQEKLPASLDDVFTNPDAYSRRDCWDHPLVYVTDGKTWTLTSYGADGKPGGVGLDTDIIFDQTARLMGFHAKYEELRRTARPTYYQVWNYQVRKNFGRYGILCFVIAFFTSLFQLLVLSDRELPSMKRIVTKPSRGLALGTAVSAAVGAAVTTFFLCLLAGLGDVF